MAPVAERLTPAPDPRICRTIAEIRAAGAAAAGAGPELSDHEIAQILALLAPYRRQLIQRKAA